MNKIVGFAILALKPRRRVIYCIGLAVSIMALAAPALCAAASDTDAAATLSACRLPEIEEPLRCGSLDVPENPDAPDGRTISLNIVVIPALRPDPMPDPWAELVGGPGNAATDFARSFTTDLRYLRQDRDVLLVDQRGTGKSNGLYCEELALHRVSSLFPRWPKKGVRACRKRLSHSADLSQYSTKNAARDLEAVRVRLGYSQLNLFGSSYGTRLALDYMRQYPDHVRSAMLWGVVAPDFRRPLYYARDGQQALDRLLDDCRSDNECVKIFPHSREELATVLTELGRAPRKVTIVHPVDGTLLKAKITKAGFAQALWTALSYPDQAHRLPGIIHRAAGGDYQPFLDLDVATKPPRRRYYNAMHLSVACPEETAHIRRDEIAPLYRDTFMPVDRALEYVQACKEWSLALTPDSELKPVTAPIPTLIVSGYMDPITPPAWGEAVHRALPNSRHLIVRHLSHESAGLDGSECLDQLFEAFVNKPEPEALDASCIDQISQPAFAIEAASKP